MFSQLSTTFQPNRSHMQCHDVLLVMLIAPSLIFANVASAQGESSGYVELGYRSVDVDGSYNKFRQHINLDDGWWISDFNWIYKPQETSNWTPDVVEIRATDIGDQPFEAFHFDVRKYGQYHFNYQRQKSAYFYQDILSDPEDDNIPSWNSGDFHHFDFDRVRDRLKFNVQLNDRAKLLLDLDQYSKEGEGTTVFDISREEFELSQPIDQEYKDHDLGFEYRWDQADFSFHQRWRDFDHNLEAFLVGPSEGSDPIDPTRLDDFFLGQPHGYDSQESQLDFTYRPNDQWVLHTNLLYADLDMDVSSLEVASGIDFLGELLQTNLTTEGQSERTIRQSYLSAIYVVTDRIRVTASFRNQDLRQNTDFNAVQVSNESQWRIDSDAWSIGLESIINQNWTINGGFTTEDRQTTFTQSADVDTHLPTENSQLDGYFWVLSYQPNNGFSMHLSAEDNVIDDPFTLSSPTESLRYRLRMSYRWTTGLKFNASYLWRNNENDVSGWDMQSKQTNLRLSYHKEPIVLSLGTTLVDLDRYIEQNVTSGFLETLFPIDYRADSDFWDGSLRWQINKRADFFAHYRYYDNDGSFVVKRKDAKLGFKFNLPENYYVGANYRYIDYTEDFESYDADIMELTFGLSW